jgi:multidrug efflux pump subunit AcrA (membrane-fusion protein)
VILPQTAVLSDEQGSYTLIVGTDQRVERRGITIAGAHAEGLLVSSGLTGNERVVAIAGAFLRAGEQVQVAPVATADRTDGTGRKGATAGAMSVAAGAP